jgi:hypothetical protein
LFAVAHASFAKIPALAPRKARRPSLVESLERCGDNPGGVTPRLGVRPFGLVLVDECVGQSHDPHFETVIKGVIDEERLHNRAAKPARRP